MGLVRTMKRVLLQLALTAALVIIPCQWVQSSKDFTATGLAVSGCCLCYALLPWDLIPDWIPFVGKLDDSLAIVGLVAGGILTGIGLSIAIAP